MLKTIRIGLVWGMLLWTACSPRPAQENRIVVTIEPQRFLAEQLVDSLFEIVTWVPIGSSPESYDPAPREMMQLARSKAYFCIGHIGFEINWLERLKANHPQVRFFDNSRGVDLIGGHHCHEPKTASHRHPATIDPHIWTSPRRVKTLAGNMLDALLEIDPDHADRYRNNCNRLLLEIDETDQKIRTLLLHPSPRAFIIYHPSLTYFADDYGLTQYAIEAEGKEPSPEQLKQLVDLAKREDIRTVLIQKEFDRKNAEIIARETGCRLEVIDPLSYHWSEELIRIAKILSHDE
jgi:zinc transport system substrate-binding protein